MPSKVLIIGAGPSGTACAATLHRLGHEVVVVDKATFPRDKCCGDGLTTNALRILEELEFDPARVPDWQTCSDVEMRSFSGRKIDLPLPSIGGQFAAIAPRAQLDHALVEHCRDMGITIHEGCAFESITHHDTNGISVRVENLGELTVDYVVAADGMWSPVRKSLGLSTQGYLGEWHAFRQYASNVTGTSKDRLHVWFDKDLLPGYAWSFPLKGGRANVGFGILRGGKYSVQEMKDLWPNLLQRPHIREALGATAVMEDRHTAWPIPARVTTAALSSGRVLFVGDAACVTDTLTGEGIGQALLSGQLAGQAIIKTGNREASIARRNYDKLVKQHLFADHRMSVTLGKILQSSIGARGALRLASLTPWTRRNFVRWMFEDEPRAAAFTPRRWHKGFLKRDGAFKNYG